MVFYRIDLFDELNIESKNEPFEPTSIEKNANPFVEIPNGRLIYEGT